MYPTHAFRLILDRPPTDDEFDALAECCDDGGFERGGPDSGWAAAVSFDRAEQSLVRAVATAIENIEDHGIKVLSVLPIELIRDEDILARAKMDARTLHQRILLSSAAHPKPMCDVGHPEAPFYRWSEVRDWLHAHRVETDYDATIAAADLTLSQIHVRDRQALEREIENARDWASRWQMPEWMEPHREDIRGCDPDKIEEFVFRLQYEKSLAFTNIVVFTMAVGIQEQVHLLERLHAAGKLGE